MEGATIEKISKALANETRLRIFAAIANNKEINCSAIVALRGVTAGTVSHHLRILAQAGLIESRRHGQFVHNRALPKTIQNYVRVLSRFFTATRQKERKHDTREIRDGRIAKTKP